MNNIEMFGETIPQDLLKVKRAKQLMQYILSINESYLKIFEIHQDKDREIETIIFDIGVERPQKIVNDIKKTERLAVVFHADDIHAPDVLSLRENFPIVPHLNLQLSEYPKSLCLFEEPYETIKLTLTPSKFVQQIQNWLNKTSVGKLHEEEQALEPFILSTPYNLILPRSFELDEPALINIVACEEDNNFTFFLTDNVNNKNNQFIAIGLRVNSTKHGIIRFTPVNLQKLTEILLTISFDLNAKMIEFLKNIYKNKQSDAVLDRKVIFILSIPLFRYNTNYIERTDNYAFITDKTLNDIGIQYGIFGKKVDSTFKGTGIIIGEKIEIGDLSKTNLCQAKILLELDSFQAALYNNVQEYSGKITAIGLGAMGSQVINNLIRSGFGRWTFIDNDIFLPHNAARHLLPSCFAGRVKINICRDILNTTIDQPLVDEAICANVLNPSKEKKEMVTMAFEKSDFNFDFSASIAVSRFIANNNTFKRSLSVYLTPDGKSLIVAIEDGLRKIRLDWLEMLHYREVINNKDLFESLNNPTYHRYGNSCRDISVQLSQDDFSIWSGYASKIIRELVTKQTASLNILYQQNYDVKQIIVNIGNIKYLITSNWKIIIDDYLITKMSEFREKSLPNETGGVLLGNFDNQNEICYIIDFLLPPSDSEGLPVSFIRGCEGLYEKTKEIETRTLEQVRYIGEWHSHPNGCPVKPSEADLATFKWIENIMNKDSVPTIMIIIGENKELCLMNSDPIIS
jgi:proteasome lid subunit RPN8/RPN11